MTRQETFQAVKGTQKQERVPLGTPEEKKKGCREGFSDLKTFELGLKNSHEETRVYVYVRALGGRRKKNLPINF